MVLKILNTDDSLLVTLNDRQSKFIQLPPECVECDSLKLSNALKQDAIPMFFCSKESIYCHSKLIAFLDGVSNIAAALNRVYPLNGDYDLMFYIEDAFVRNGIQFRHDFPKEPPLIFIVSDLLDSVFQDYFSESVCTWLFEHSLSFFAMYGNDTIHAIIKCLAKHPHYVRKILTKFGDNGDFEWLYFIYRHNHQGRDFMTFARNIDIKFVLHHNISLNLFACLNSLRFSSDPFQIKDFFMIKEICALSEDQRYCVKNYSAQFQERFGTTKCGCETATCTQSHLHR
jgi:hypothetical protein